ncbi:farnesol dehydrogenase [Tribolium castaneum]|uniref:Dehydrogenase/reductase SDR family member 11-like Protein n=1 Tax=Tribolium castaneum TaxID=7070 RepID=D7EJA1_TRICA|nr:PREDICTED: farnesol dehydrogenase [Tribolium castaneum]EFA12618.1 Dehydrogenase/reductase SDR family member 11-like Protein [Tribolium castaneum]|eukprot:XP_970153.3 PREDICTED: farnesol dehydrogenase [Tribolium castaneum]
MVLSMEKWVGKVAIVTGASSGIGAAIAEKLVEQGLTVVGVARRVALIETQAQKLSNKKGKLHAVKADLTVETDVLDAFKWTLENLGPVHILVNNAGILKEELLTRGQSEDWKRAFEVNVLALCIATREAVKIMNAHNIDGHIIHINSILGHHVAIEPKLNVYPATKHAVTALTETLRQELNSLGSKIKVTSISPGLVVSELTLLSKNISEERRKNFEGRPILQAEDIADGVVYALSTPPHVQVHELTIKPVGEPI